MKTANLKRVAAPPQYAPKTNIKRKPPMAALPDDEPVVAPRGRSAPDPGADELINDSLARARERKAEAQRRLRTRKRTPRHQQVENEDLHTANESDRQLDGRHAIERDSEAPIAWQRASALDAPPPRPGYKQRWIAYKRGGQEDSDNLEKALDEGWLPRKPATVRREHELTATFKGKYGQYIVKRGLILCEIPTKTLMQKSKFFRGLQQKMTLAIDRDRMRLNNRVMPLLEPERSTSVAVSARRGRLDDAVPGDEPE